MDGERNSQSPPRRNRLKFLCSYGGKILPRPSNGQLRYVGGETRLVAVARTITFSELVKKLCSLFDDDVVLKYQLIPEELDALVSVTCDEDLHHMIDEYDNHDNKFRASPADTSRLRAFCFPRSQVIFDDNVFIMDPTAQEHRYIDAVNGVTRSPSTTSNNSSYHPAFTLSSGGSSPKFGSNEQSFPPGGENNQNAGHYDFYTALGEVAVDQCSYHRNMCRVRELQRVQSSPNLLNGGSHHCHHHHHHPQHQHQYHLYQQQPSSRLGRLAPPPIVTAGSELGRLAPGQVQMRRYSPTGRHQVKCCGCGHNVEGSSPVSGHHRMYGSGGAASDGLVHHLPNTPLGRDS